MFSSKEMQPKDLLVHLEKGDRTMEMIKENLDHSPSGFGVTSFDQFNTMQQLSGMQNVSSMQQVWRGQSGLGGNFISSGNPGGLR